MVQYIVTRHGSNAANQPMTQSAIVGTVEAKDRKAAAAAAAQEFNCYNNQHLSVEAASRCSKSDCQQAIEADMARNSEAEAWTN